MLKTDMLKKLYYKLPSIYQNYLNKAASKLANNAEEEFPTRLAIPITNFTVTFSKLGYVGIKKVLDNNDVNHERFMVKQSVDLKRELQGKGITNKKTHFFRSTW